jgi:hypothetical protein
MAIGAGRSLQFWIRQRIHQKAGRRPQRHTNSSAQSAKTGRRKYDEEFKQTGADDDPPRTVGAFSRGSAWHQREPATPMEAGGTGQPINCRIGSRATTAATQAGRDGTRHPKKALSIFSRQTRV